jgi:hypothetical protein
MDRLIGEFYLFTRERRRAFGDLDRQVSHTGGFLQRQHRAGGKAPGAVIEHADPKPPVLRFSNRRDPAVLAANGLGRAVEEADIAVLSSRSHHAFQREFGEFVLMRIRKSGHSVCILTEAPTPFNLPYIEELGFSHAIPYDVTSCCLPNGRRVNESST